MATDRDTTAGADRGTPQPRRLWLGFMIGFLLLFVGMLFLTRKVAMAPSGQYAVEYPLWQFYTATLPRLLGPSALGPANGGGSALVETALTHLLISASGGAAAVAVGLCIRRFGNRRAAKPRRGFRSPPPA